MFKVVANLSEGGRERERVVEGEGKRVSEREGGRGSARDWRSGASSLTAGSEFIGSQADFLG